MNAFRRTRIVATLGPASEDPRTVRDLIEAGVNVFRLNFSYGDHDYHGRLIDAVRDASKRAGSVVAVMQDLQGPKIRVGALQGGSVRLRRGAKLRITSGDVTGDAERIAVTYDRLARDVNAGDRILLDEGAIELAVESASGGEVVCQVIRGGVLQSGKGMNLPGVNIRAPALTAKDREDLRFGLRRGVDLVALSFVRSPRDVDQARKVMRQTGRRVPVVAKIEKPQALRQLAAVLRSFDGVMVARGDLGVEIGPEKVPLEQKHIIESANAAGKPVITATQMLESMITSPRPTRAEASDVANAVLDGTDAVMLSGETAAGRHAVESVRVMDRIIREAESIGEPRAVRPSGRPTRAQSVCYAAVHLAHDVGAVALAALTRSGRTARALSSLRPAVPIYAIGDREDAARRLAVSRGVMPLVVERLRREEDAIQRIERELRQRRLVSPGDDIVVVGSAPEGPPGGTNFIRLLHIA